MIAQALASRQSTLSEFDSKRLLAGYGIPTTREILVDSLAEAEAAAAQIGYPVVLKVCSALMAHKTEHRLLEMGITHVSDLQKAFNRLAPKAKEYAGRVLVQELVVGSRELVMGLIRDPLLGPCVMFGLGGIFTEVLQDVVFRVAPLSADDAMDMIQEIKSYKLLQSIRGMESVDLKELSGYLVKLGRIGTEHPAIQAIDVNPLIVRQGHPVAVDGLVEVAEAQPRAHEAPIAQPSSLKPFFEPSSVVVIGASQTPHKPGNEVIRNILANEYEGGLYLVNPRGGEILGHKVHRSIQELPDGIDVGIIILPAAATPQAIRDCAAKGIKAIVLAAGGFAEVDERGEALQAETILAVRETGVRVIGPNTSGHTSMPCKFTSSFYALGKIPRGHVSYLAQTGNFATHTMRYIITGEHFGVARVVGLGNKVDVEESEVLEYYGNDPETKAIFVYLESFKRPRRFLEVARRVTRHKPVVLLKGGATQEGARAAVAHTAALASDDRIIDGALQQAGIVRDCAILASVSGCQGPGDHAASAQQSSQLHGTLRRHAGEHDRFLPTASRAARAGRGGIHTPALTGNQPGIHPHAQPGGHMAGRLRRWSGFRLRRSSRCGDEGSQH
jgi:acyl-CoA synthetase (NDP forming)